MRSEPNPRHQGQPPRAAAERRKLVAEVKARLRRNGLARLQMSIIVMATGLAGFAASGLLLALGVSAMGLRYGLALLFAYGVSLMMVRIWAWSHQRRIQGKVRFSDYLDVTNFIPSPGGESGSSSGASSGGSWGGSGDSGSSADFKSAGGGGGDGFDALDLLDVDDGWVFIVPLVLAVGSLIAGLVVVWAAPTLLAEVVLDVLLVSSLYHRLEHLESRHWLRTAVEKTWVPAACVGVLLVAGGTALQNLVPEAKSIGDVITNI